MNKLLSIGLFSFLLTISHAGVFDGVWRVDLPQRGNITLHSFFTLQQNDTALAGNVVVNGSVDLPLRDAHLEGSDAVFTCDWGISYRVHPEDGQLRVTVSQSGREPEQTIAVRVSAAEARPPASIPLPALLPVPANGLTPTPPMGWNSWNHFKNKVDDQIVRETADALVSSGLAAAGYVYINVDDCWAGGRAADGTIFANTNFPDMKALADYVHSRGLKFGLYSSPGPVTCGGFPGSYGHEEQDAKTFAAWGVDYLKYDWCSASRVYTNADLQAACQKMGRALADCGRPIVYSLCEYGLGDVWKWGRQTGANLWRVTGDIQDNWKSMTEIGFNQSRLAPYAGPGGWNDLDMLQIGNGGMTDTEYRTHFSLWCLVAAPLIAGNDLRHMPASTREILGNRELIAVDQDSLGRAGERRASRAGLEWWTKPLHDGSVAIGVFNRTDSEKSATLTWAELGCTTPPKTVRDLWQHHDLPPAVAGYAATVPAHGAVVLRVR